MAKRKQEAAEAVQHIPTEETEMQASATAIAEPTEAGSPKRQWRPNPFPLKTVNLDGYKVCVR